MSYFCFVLAYLYYTTAQNARWSQFYWVYKNGLIWYDFDVNREKAPVPTQIPIISLEKVGTRAIKLPS